MIASPSAPPLSSLWCCCEALVAYEYGVQSITAEGLTSDLVAGASKGIALRAAEEAVYAARREASTAAIVALEWSDLEGCGSKEAHKELRRAERRQAECERRKTDSENGLAVAQMDVLVSKSSEVLELDDAKACAPEDRAAIRAFFKMHGLDRCRRQLATFVRKSVCAISVASRNVAAVDGVLGPLSLSLKRLQLGVQNEAASVGSAAVSRRSTCGGDGLGEGGAAVANGRVPDRQPHTDDNQIDEPTIESQKHDVNDPACVMHLAAWLWRGPAVAHLDLSACSPLRPEVPRVVCAALAAGCLKSLVSVNLDGVALPVQRISGAEHVSTIDLSFSHLGLASALVLAALLVSNVSVTHLNLSGNALRDEGVVAIARALRGCNSGSHVCALRTIEMANTKFAIQGGKELAAAVTELRSLTHLDLQANRLCGVWVDQYGQQGAWSNEAVLALASAIRGSTTLTTLLLGGNRMRDEGVCAIVSALHDDRELRRLGLQTNEIGVRGAMELASAVAKMVALEELDLSGNMIAGVSSHGTNRSGKYTHEGIAAIIEAARVSASLRKLSIANNRICGCWSDAYALCFTDPRAPHEYCARAVPSPHTFGSFVWSSLPVGI